MLKTLEVHQLQHPGPLCHTLEGQKVGINDGGGTADVAQEFHDGHHVIAPQAAPAAGFKGSGLEHTGYNAKKLGHSLTAAGGVQGKQVGPGRAEPIFITGER